MQQRLEYIDNLKGFAILLVVLGHIIQFLYAPETYSNNLAFRTIYSFHMALFMMLSGYTQKFLPEITVSEIKSKISKRFIQLMLPFFCWGIISILFFQVKPLHLILYPSNGLWFLWALFFIYLLFLLSNYVAREIKVNILFVLILLWVVLQGGSHFLHGICGIKLIADYFPFYCIGVLVGQYKDSLIFPKKSLLIFFISLLLFIGLGQYNKEVGGPVSFAIKFLTALAGCYSCFLLFSFLGKRVSPIFNKIGRLTLGIYAVHQPIILLIKSIPNINFLDILSSIWGVLIYLAIILVLSLLCIKLLKLTRITSLLFLGIK